MPKTAGSFLFMIFRTSRPPMILVVLFNQKQKGISKMKKFLIIIPTALLVLSSAYSASLGPGTSTLSCLCSDESVVVTGKKCPDGTLCGGLTPGFGDLYKDCSTGYYGQSTDGVTGCTSCATATGHSSATADFGATVITDCYLPSGTAVSDTTGSGTYTSKCYYSN